MLGEQPLLGVVLAGGASRRMGQDKAQLQVRGRRLLDHMLALLRDCGIDDCVVSGAHQGYRCVADLHEGAGPMSALHALAQALPDSRLLIVAVDMPAIRVTWLQHLLNTAPRSRCLHFTGAPLPLRLDTDAFTRDALGDLMTRCQPSQRSLQNLLLALSADAQAWPTDFDPRTLAECNTPSEWQAMLELISQSQRSPYSD